MNFFAEVISLTPQGPTCTNGGGFWKVFISLMSFLFSAVSALSASSNAGSTCNWGARQRLLRVGGPMAVADDICFQPARAACALWAGDENAFQASSRSKHPQKPSLCGAKALISIQKAKLMWRQGPHKHSQKPSSCSAKALISTHKSQAYVAARPS